MSKRKLAGIIAGCVIVVIVLLVIFLGPASVRVVTFPDRNLETAVREALNKPWGPIRASELASLGSIGGRSRGIENLSGLQYCTSLVVLDLMHNQISDISPLANLTNLKFLYLGNNPLSSDSINIYIPQLEARGVIVSY